MGKDEKKKKTKKKTKPKVEERIFINMSFEEAMKVAAITPVNKKSKK